MPLEDGAVRIPQLLPTFIACSIHFRGAALFY